MKEVIEQTYGEPLYEGHLGGCSAGGDKGTYYPEMWEYLKFKYGINSVLDVGCGVGYSAKLFESMGCEIQGIDGSLMAADISLIKDKLLIHDYEHGPALTNDTRTFDLCWSCEFVEHVWEKFSQNFLEDFKKCKYVAMTYAYPGQGGHHHVNENTQEYWIDVMDKNGFDFLEKDTLVLRSLAEHDVEPQYRIYNHFFLRGLLFKSRTL